MATAPADNSFQWLRGGDAAFAAMLAAIEAARSSIRLEMYYYTESPVGDRFRAALVAAAARGVRVRVLNDAFGCISLPEHYWWTLRAAGGEQRLFNPLDFGRMNFRDHRKLLVCDEAVAFIGGFNFITEAEGDGVNRGWMDHGLRLEGPLVKELAAAFEEMFTRALYHHQRFTTLRRSPVKRQAGTEAARLLLSGPGRGPNPITRAINLDLAKAREVAITMAYFVPTWGMRRLLGLVVQRGGRVRLLLPGPSDVVVSKLASQSTYRRLMRAGMELYEYQPQILHAKVMIIDDVVYLGSANLDPRSQHINYELMVRLQNPAMAAQAREMFAADLTHSRRLDLKTWRRSRTLWMRLKSHIAHFLLVRVDPHLANWQLKYLR